MDLSILNQPLPVVENPGLETTDPRLEAVSSLVQRAEYLEAAGQAEAILCEGIYDIRLIGFFMYGVFLEQGIGSLKGIFDCCSGLLHDNWSALGPAAKREKHTQTSLRWFLNQLQKKLQLEDSNKSELWEHWLSEVTSEEVGDAIEAADGMRRALSMTLEDAATPLIDALAKLSQWLAAFQQIIYREAEQGAEVEAGEAGEEEAAGPSDRRADTDGRRTSSGGAAALDAPSIEGSYHLRLLIEKMEAFERLIAEEKYPRAALVADDINETLAAFDPRLFFPRLFARFAFLQATHIQELVAFEEEKQSPEWQALKDFYKVDLKGFVDS